MATVEVVIRIAYDPDGSGGGIAVGSEVLVDEYFYAGGEADSALGSAADTLKQASDLCWQRAEQAAGMWGGA